MKVRLLLFFFLAFATLQAQQKDARFVSFTIEASQVSFYWKDDRGQILKSILNLKTFIENQNSQLRFAMNGGMYTRENASQGLFIENALLNT